MDTFHNDLRNSVECGAEGGGDNENIKYYNFKF